MKLFSEEEYEWLGGFQCYKSILQKYLSKHQRSDSILQLGKLNKAFKGRVIYSDPLCKDDNARFLKVPLKALSD